MQPQLAGQSPSNDHTELEWKRSLIETHLRAGVIPLEQLGRFGVERIGQLVATAGPWLPGEELVLLADLAATLEAARATLSHPSLATSELDLRVQRYAACAAGTRLAEVAADPVARALCAIGQRLWRAPLGRPLWPEWMGRIFEVLEEHAAERGAGAHHRHGLADGDLDAYLVTHRHGSGLGVMTIAAWMLIGESELGNHLDHFAEAEGRFAVSARLAADLRGPRGTVAEAMMRSAGEAAMGHRLTAELRAGLQSLSLAPSRTELSAAWLGHYASLVCRV